MDNQEQHFFLFTIFYFTGYYLVTIFTIVPTIGTRGIFVLFYLILVLSFDCLIFIIICPVATPRYYYICLNLHEMYDTQLLILRTYVA